MWVNPYSGHGTARDRRIATYYRLDIVTNDEAAALWRTEWLAARIIEDPVNEAFRTGWKLQIDDEQVAKAVATRASELFFDQQMILAGCYENAYGGGALFPVMTGALGALSDPLDTSRIERVDAVHVLEPRELQPVAWEGSLNSTAFRKPSLYQVMPLSGRVFTSPEYVHASRLAILPGIQVSSQPQPGQLPGWGDSALCRPNAVMKDFGLGWSAAASLLNEHGHGVYKLDQLLETLATDNGLDLLQKRLEAMDMAKGALRGIVIDAKDDYTRSTGTLAGVAEILIQFQQLMAAATGRPVSVLMGRAPAGLNATGQSDIQIWYAIVDAIRRARYLKPLEWLVKLLLCSTAGPTSGKEPEDWHVEFGELEAQSEADKAALHDKQADADKKYIEMQVLTPVQVARARFGGGKYSVETHLSAEDLEELERASAAPSPEEIAAMQGGGAPGGEGEGLDADPPSPSDEEIDDLEAEDAEGPAWEDDEDRQDGGARRVRRADFDPRQKRDGNGRWTAGARAERVAEEVRHSHRALNPHASDADAHQAAEHAAKAEHAAHANEQRAIESGDITEPPHEYLSKLHAAREETASSLHALRGDFDRAHREAMIELRNLEQYDHELGDRDISAEGLKTTYEHASNSLGRLRGEMTGHPHHDADHEPGEKHLRDVPEAPDRPEPPHRDDFDSDHEHAAAVHAYKRELADYESAMDGRQRDFVAQAERTQVALEKLRDAQAELTQRFAKTSKGYEREVDKADDANEKYGDPDEVVNHKRFEPHMDEHSGEFADKAWEDRYLSARHAAESLFESREAEIDDVRFGTAFDDADSAVSAAAYHTKSALSTLSSITGRKPAKVAKPRKDGWARGDADEDFDDDFEAEDDEGARDESADAELAALEHEDRTLSWDDEREDAVEQDRSDAKGYNPYRAKSGRFAPGPHKQRAKFNAAPHQRKIAKLRATEAKHRRASVELRKQMIAVKRAAKGGTPKQVRIAKAKFDRMAKRRETLRGKADAAKAAKQRATAAMREARAAHAAKQQGAQAIARANQIAEARSTRSTQHASDDVHRSKMPSLAGTRSLSGIPLEVIDAIKNGSNDDAMYAINRGIEKLGMQRSEVANRRVFVSDDGPNNGVRHWNGDIQLSSRVSESMTRYANAVEGKHYTELADRLIARDEHRKSIIGTGAKIDYDAWNAEVEQLENIKGVNGVKTLVHESLHGYSPVLPSAYREWGAQIEEITTETTARALSRDWFGVPMVAYNRGSYDGDITAAVTLISEISGAHADVAFRHLETASRKFKSRKQKMSKQSEVMSAFTDDILSTIGGNHDKNHVEDRLRYHLLSHQR